jgi:hypothetical protein
MKSCLSMVVFGIALVLLSGDAAAVGPQFTVLHADLFQDTFSEDGTVTGPARADMARDIAPPASPSIIPGDSIVVTVTDTGFGLKGDPHTGSGPAVYAYVAVWQPNQPGKSGSDLQAPEMVAGSDRYPLVDSLMHDGMLWYCFRMDSVRSSDGSIIPDKYCFDLNDNVFTPGDTICYILSATNGNDESSHFSRRINGQGDNFVTDTLWEALDSPMEFTILPATSWSDLLYVDHADDRGGPPQVFFDSAFELLQISCCIDRYDVLDASAVARNSLGSRVKNVQSQIIDNYTVILWSSGDLAVGTVGDGTGLPDKSDDFGLLSQFLKDHTDKPTVLFFGDNIAEEWVTLPGAGAIEVRNEYMNFNLVDGNHTNSGEPGSPLLTAVGANWIESGVPQQMITFAKRPPTRGFDLLEPTGLAIPAFDHLATSKHYMVTQHTPTASSTAAVALAGFGFGAITDDEPGFPPDRAPFLRRTIRINSAFGPIPFPVAAPESPLPTNRLDSAYPNPFNPMTTLRYSIDKPGPVTLRIYDVTGALVRTLVSEVQIPRTDGFVVEWDGRDDGGTHVASGVYFYSLAAKGFADTKKMVLLK